MHRRQIRVEPLRVHLFHLRLSVLLKYLGAYVYFISKKFFRHALYAYPEFDV